MKDAQINIELGSTVKYITIAITVLVLFFLGDEDIAEAIRNLIWNYSECICDKAPIVKE